MTDVFAPVRQIAEAVLYEGYVLYPYRSSARKNQLRWQFGVLAPQKHVEAGATENSWMAVECLIEPDGAAHVSGQLRFLQLQHRLIEVNGEPVESVEVGGKLYTTWDEAVERSIDFRMTLRDGEKRVLEATIPEGRDVDLIYASARIVRARFQIQAEVRFEVTGVRAIGPLCKLSIRVENVTMREPTDLSREATLRSSLLGAHLLMAVDGGQFVSLLDPPEWASAAAKGCQNVRCWPVLGGSQGERSLVLASPIILYDHPQIAPESAGNLYDGAEIDEILTLRTMTLTDEEKREARATDPRAAAIIDRVDNMPAEMLERLHGAVRGLRAVTGEKPSAEPAPWWDPGSDSSVNPDTDTVEVAGVAVRKGWRVRLNPGSSRRTDAQDMFLAGREATVQGVFLDVEDNRYLAVTVDDDPGADLRAEHGRFLYFYPDEIEPLEGP